MTRILPFACGVAMAAMLAVAPLSAQERMRPLGEVTYEPRPAEPQSGIIRLQGEDRFIRSMRVFASEGSAEVREIRLVYRDGEEQRVRVRERIREGEQTSLIRLQEPRPLREVEIIYIPVGRVNLVLRADSRPAEPPPPPPKPQWVELVCETAGFLLDRDVVNIKSDTPYEALRLRASGFDMEVNELSVKYSNGVRDVFPLRTAIPSGSVTGAIDLRSQNRRIVQIELIHRSRVLSNQKARLCVEGLRARQPVEQ